SYCGRPRCRPARRADGAPKRRANRESNRASLGVPKQAELISRYESPSPFDRIVHDQGLSTSAASGGLKPPPIRRLRWAYHHLLYSIATRAFLTHLGLPLLPGCEAAEAQAVSPSSPLQEFVARCLQGDPETA